MQNAVARSHVGVATGAANFFRALMSALVVAVLGAIVLGGLGGAAGSAVEDLVRVAPAATVAAAFRYVFAAAALVAVASLVFLTAMEERPLRGPASADAPEP
jgi:hypothetical protein